MNNNNPIFLEYYYHEDCRCYKVLNPWTKYAEDKRVLCREDEGYELALIRAKDYLTKCLEEAFQSPIKDPSKE